MIYVSTLKVNYTVVSLYILLSIIAIIEIYKYYKEVKNNDNRKCIK